MFSFPFKDLLDTLRRRDIAVGVADYLAAARLIERWNGESVADLRLAFAALLSTNLDERAVILETFDALYPATPPPPPPPPPPPTPHPGILERARRALRPWHLGVVLLLVLGSRLPLRAMLDPGIPPPPPSPWSPPAKIQALPIPGSVAPKPIVTPTEPDLPASPSVTNISAIVVPSVLAGAFFVTLVLAFRSRRDEWASSLQQWRDTLAGMAGPFYYSPAVDLAQPLEVHKAVGDAATILGRRFAEHFESDYLDVDRSLAETLQAGLRPAFVFETPPVASPILVLRDTASEMRTWNRKVDLFLKQLVRSGVLLECWYFDEDASLVSRTPHGRTISIGTLAHRGDGAALLVISTGAGVSPAMARRSRWWDVLATWEDRAWLTPIANPLYWRAELRTPGILRVPVWPMTRLGVIAAARALTGGDVKRVAALQPERAVSAGDVERMKRIVALVPYPTLELAEHLRQRFLPEVPEEVVMFLADGTGSSGAIRLDEAEIKRLVSAVRTEAPAGELQVRRFLREVIEGSEPAPESAAHLRWQLDRALQDLHLSTLAPGQESRPTAILERLADGPLAIEVRRALDLAAAAPPLHNARAIKTLQARAPATPAPSGLTGSGYVRRLTWPGVPELAAGVAAAAVAALVAWGTLAPDVIPHRREAYSLQWRAGTAQDPRPAGSLDAAVAGDDPSTPRTAALYRDDQLIGNVSIPSGGGMVYQLPPTETGASYHLRAPLPAGNLAVSNAVYAPVAPATSTGLATLSVNLLPWAQVRIVRSDGSVADTLSTPFSIELVEGSYTLEASNAGLAPLTLPITLVAGVPFSVNQAMPGFDANQLVNSLLARGKS